MVLFLVYKGMWWLRDRVLWFNGRLVFPSWRRGNFLLASFFVGIAFHTKKNQHHTGYLLLKSLIAPPPPKWTMSSHVVKIAQEMMEKKRIKTNIEVGSVVLVKVGDMEENIREWRIRRMRKELMGCVQSVVGKKKLVVQFKTLHKKEMIYCSIVYVCSKEEICLEMGDPISNLPEK